MPDLAPNSHAWPDLPLHAWRETYATLHMWTQIVGKTRLAFAPAENHWWHAALYVDARGLTTGPIPHRSSAFQVSFDFVDHRLVVSTSDGSIAEIGLFPCSVAEFYRDYLATMAGLGIDVRLRPVPVEIEHAVPFAEDRAHCAYDAEFANRCWRVFAQVDRVLKRFRGRFLGKASPVHFFWGSFDLAASRFSGRRAPRHPGGMPNCPDWVMHEAYSHEVISAGFWPGSGPVQQPAFYAYAYPEPRGLPDAAVRPVETHYDHGMREFILPYDAVRRAPSPEDALREFLESTYGAAADLARWDRRALERGD